LAVSILSPKQVASWTASTTTDNFTLWDGAIRSGKTFISLLAFLSWLPKAPRGAIGILGKTRTTIVRNILDAISLISPKAIGNYSVHSESVMIMGRKVWLIGASDNLAEEKLRGLTMAGAYVDEVTIIPESMFVQLLGRLSVPGARLFGTTNPDNPAHWLKTGYIDRADELGWGFWHFTMDDNPSLTPDYVEAKKREFTGLWYRRFIQGEWVSAEGAVFDMWDPEQHVIPWADIPPIVDFLATGIDYGTSNATSAIALALCEDNRLYAVNECRIDKTNRGPRTLTDGEQSKWILDWLNEGNLAPKNDYKPQYTIIDPAAASFKTQMNADGAWNIIDADNDVSYGIRTVANGLSGGWLRIADTCAGLIKEIPGYSWDPKAEARGEDKPIKVADHSVDALRYAVTTTENRWRPAIDHYMREEARNALAS
jgi:PBSX family phage terminase large subunit